MMSPPPRPPAPPRRRRGRPPWRELLAGAAAALAVAALAGCAVPTRDAPAPPAKAAPLRSLSASCLQLLYLRGSEEAMAGRLARGEIAGCSVVYQTLLERHFGGDFLALHAWSRRQPDSPDATDDGCAGD